MRIRSVLVLLAASLVASSGFAVSIVPTGTPADAPAAARGAAISQLNAQVADLLVPRAVDVKIFARGDGTCWLHAQAFSRMVNLTNASVIELVQAPGGLTTFVVSTAGNRVSAATLSLDEGRDLFLKAQLCLTRP